MKNNYEEIAIKMWDIFPENLDPSTCYTAISAVLTNLISRTARRKELTIANELLDLITDNTLKNLKDRGWK